MQRSQLSNKFELNPRFSSKQNPRFSLLLHVLHGLWQVCQHLKQNPPTAIMCFAINDSLQLKEKKTRKEVLIYSQDNLSSHRSYCYLNTKNVLTLTKKKASHHFYVTEIDIRNKIHYSKPDWCSPTALCILGQNLLLPKDNRP